MTRQFCIRTLAFTAIALFAFTTISRADIPPGPYRPQPQPQPTETPQSKPLTKPGACGSGVGLAFAGLAVAWGLIRMGKRRVAAVQAV